MKKHIIPIMNIILAIVILGGVGLLVYNGVFKDKGTAVAPTEAVESDATGNNRSKSTSEHFKIGVVQHTDMPTSQKCYEGFLDRFKEREVFDDLEFDYVFEVDETKCKQEIERLSKSDCDLIFTIGQFASENAAKTITDIPVVFADVTDPEQLEAVASNEAPGKNVTGVSTYTPCFEQIDLIPLLLPEKKKVGCIYCVTDTTAMTQALIAEEEATANQKLSFESYTISDNEDLEDALDYIEDDEIEVLYLPTDALVFENIEDIIEFTNENKIPVICADEPTLKAGGFATCLINYGSVGGNSADIAYSILYEKKQAGTIPVMYVNDCFNYVNQSAVSTLGVSIPGEALNSVELRKYDMT
ncbi:MAG: ABC transporter substrate-binding protein [Ruminococcus sp.]|nr:ABC transporter substrate-binding protein [Ruminococcus sp.]